VAEEIAQEAGGAFGLCGLSTEVGELFLRLLKGVALDEHGLGEDVEGVGVTAQGVLKIALGLGVFFGKLRVIDPVGEVLKHLLLLRGHRSPLLR